MKFTAIFTIWLFGVMAAAAQDAMTVHTAGHGVSRPTIVKTKYPQYTAEAMRAKIHGSNMVEAIVLPDGTVGEVKVVKSLDSKLGLDDATVKAVKQWLFKPGFKDGEPVAVRITVAVAYSGP